MKIGVSASKIVLTSMSFISSFCLDFKGLGFNAELGFK